MSSLSVVYYLFMEPNTSKDILILYHGDCTDGFAAAYAAWKKFGDNADYIPQHRNLLPSVELLKDKEVYVLDYSYSEEEMLLFESVAKKFVVIDHHLSSEEAVKKVKEHIFAIHHSGAYLAWEYFHPQTEVPKMIQYISDSDIWTHELPDWEYIEAYIYRDDVSRFTFPFFENLDKELSTEDGYNKAKEIGEILHTTRYATILKYVDQAELVLFEGYEVYAINAPREVRGEVGDILARKTNLFSIIFTYQKGLWKCSLRSVAAFDVTPLVKKYNGGGHKNASAFIVPTEFPLPFVQIVKEVEEK